MEQLVCCGRTGRCSHLLPCVCSTFSTRIRSYKGRCCGEGSRRKFWSLPCHVINDIYASHKIFSSVGSAPCWSLLFVPNLLTLVLCPKNLRMQAIFASTKILLWVRTNIIYFHATEKTHSPQVFAVDFLTNNIIIRSGASTDLTTNWIFIQKNKFNESIPDSCDFRWWLYIKMRACTCGNEKKSWNEKLIWPTQSASHSESALKPNNACLSMSIVDFQEWCFVFLPRVEWKYYEVVGREQRSSLSGENPQSWINNLIFEFSYFSRFRYSRQLHFQAHHVNLQYHLYAFTPSLSPLHFLIESMNQSNVYRISLPGLSSHFKKLSFELTSLASLLHIFSDSTHVCIIEITAEIGVISPTFDLKIALQNSSFSAWFRLVRRYESNWHGVLLRHNKNKIFFLSPISSLSGLGIHYYHDFILIRRHNEVPGNFPF